MWTVPRSAQRQALRLPLYFRTRNDSELISSTSENISQTGLFMSSHARLKTGALLSLSVQIPTYISGSYRCYFHCAGCVIHERELSAGLLGYGVKFEHMLSARHVVSSPIEAIARANACPPVFLEKRRNVRHAVQLQASFRALDYFQNVEIPGETRNVSRYGVFLTSRVLLKVGAPLRLALHTHAPVADSAFGPHWSKARIVHAQALNNGTMGYGVEIEQALPRISSPKTGDEDVQIAWA